MTFVPPRVDCAIFDAPTSEVPALPPLKGSKAEWQLFSYAVMTYAEGLLGQRVDTAQCVAKMREVGLVK